ncbi:Uncharacterised protein [Salmonella enterica subsp. enterica serovar Bovismorbificans]|nr:Uncharacterised protein [Salmonella enterica subsp. enterica serovar Bovismorbificans]
MATESVIGEDFYKKSLKMEKGLALSDYSYVTLKFTVAFAVPTVASGLTGT